MRIFFGWLFLMIILFGCERQKKPDHHIENLRTFAKIYGYVKYFHPSDEAAALDWDRFAIYGAKEVEKAKNQEELVDILNKLFLPIAPSMIIHSGSEKVAFDLNQIIPTDTTDFKAIAWQHYGVGLNPNSRYQFESVRVNRQVEKKPNPNIYGSLVHRFDGSPYQGLEFQLEAYVKTNITSTRGGFHLWLRVDRDGGETGFHDNMRYAPIWTPEWKRYTISGKIDKDAAFINMGAMTVGTGEAWVDGYHLKVKDGTGWKSVKTESFETYPNGDLSESWQVGMGKGTSGQSKSHMFYPSADEAYKGNYSLKIVVSDSSTFSPAKVLFEAYPNHGEYIDEGVGSNLRLMLPLSLLGDGGHTYPKANQAEFEALIEAIKSEVQGPFSGEDRQVRFADIVIMWNVFQHFYPYFDVVDVDWDAALTEVLRQSYEDQNEMDFLRTLKKFTAKLKDGHIDVSLNVDTTTKYTLPFEWEWVEKQLVLTNVLDETLDLEVGNIVLEIDGITSEGYFEQAKQYISAASDSWMNNKVSRHTLRGPKDSAVHLKVIGPNQKERVETVRRTMTRRDHSTAREDKKDVKFNQIRPGIYYLNLARISMTEIDSLIPELGDATGVICDFREGPGFSIEDFISHLLTEDDTSTSWMGIPQIIYPNFENLVGFDHFGFDLKAKTPHINAKVVFIANGRSISYMESILGLVDHYELATIIGEPTAGTNGNINPFSLPGGYHTWWTGMRVVKHDGSTHHGVGIIPDVHVFKTIDGIREGRDEFLEKAIEILVSD